MPEHMHFNQLEVESENGVTSWMPWIPSWSPALKPGNRVRFFRPDAFYRVDTVWVVKRINVRSRYSINGFSPPWCVELVS